MTETGQQGEMASEDVIAKQRQWLDGEQEHFSFILRGIKQPWGLDVEALRALLKTAANIRVKMEIHWASMSVCKDDGEDVEKFASYLDDKARRQVADGVRRAGTIFDNLLDSTRAEAWMYHWIGVHGTSPRDEWIQEMRKMRETQEREPPEPLESNDERRDKS